MSVMADPKGGWEGRAGIVTKLWDSWTWSIGIEETHHHQKELYKVPKKEDKSDSNPVLEISLIYLLVNKVE